MTKVNDKERILKAAREKQSINYKGTPLGSQLISVQKDYRPEGSGKIYLKCWKEKICNLEYFTQQEYHLN